MSRVPPHPIAFWPHDRAGDCVVSTRLPRPSLGLIYVLCVPLLAGIATVRGVNIGGFNYSGFLWVIALGLGGLLLLVEKEIQSERPAYFPAGPWIAWVAYIGLSFAWLDNPSYLQVQYALQLGMPVLVGILASLFITSRRELEQLVRAYFFSLLLLMAFVGLCVVGVLSQDELDPVFVTVRPLSMTAVVIAGLFIAGTKRKFTSSWIGWAACLVTAVITGSRMASLAILLLPILNPTTRNPLRKAAAIAVVGLVGVGVYWTPVFQERFFRGESGSAGQVMSGDFDSAGRFETWPLILQETLTRPWLGHGVGSVQVFIPEVWPEVSHPHNDYLRVAYEFGGLGLMLFLGVMGWQLWNLGHWIRRTDGVVQQAFAGAWLGLVTFLPIAFTDNPIVYHLWYMNPVFALMGAAYAVSGQEEHDSAAADRGATWLPGSGPQWQWSHGSSRGDALS